MANRDKPDDNCHNASLSVYPIGSLFFAAIGDDELPFVISDYPTLMRAVHCLIEPLQSNASV